MFSVTFVHYVHIEVVPPSQFWLPRMVNGCEAVGDFPGSMNATSFGKFQYGLATTRRSPTLRRYVARNKNETKSTILLELTLPSDSDPVFLWVS